MSNIKRNKFFLTVLGAVLLISNTCMAKETPKFFQGIEFLTGFGAGKLREKGNYHINTLRVAFDFDLKNLTRKINFSPAQLLQFQIEPFISFVSSPDSNIETGSSFLFKAGILPQTSKFQPYIKGGAGIIYITQHTREQSTQFNFTEQLGLGMHYFFRKNIAFTLESFYRHLSNASVKRPNKGINNCFILGGIAYQF